MSLHYGTSRKVFEFHCHAALHRNIQLTWPVAFERFFQKYFLQTRRWWIGSSRFVESKQGNISWRQSWSWKNEWPVFSVFFLRPRRSRRWWIIQSLHGSVAKGLGVSLLWIVCMCVCVCVCVCVCLCEWVCLCDWACLWVCESVCTCVHIYLRQTFYLTISLKLEGKGGRWEIGTRDLGWMLHLYNYTLHVSPPLPSSFAKLARKNALRGT